MNEVINLCHQDDFVCVCVCVSVCVCVCFFSYVPAATNLI